MLRAYVRARYGERIVRDLQEMLGFRTFAREGKDNWSSPEFLRQRQWLGGRAAALGLGFKDYDGRVDEITLPGPKPVLEAEIEKRLAERTSLFSRRTGVPIAVQVEISSEPHLAPVDGKVVQSLLVVWREVTGTPGRPIAVGGGTQARLFPGGVDFGPVLSMEHYRGHGTDEYMTVDELLRVAELTTAAVWSLARPVGPAP